MSIRSTRERVVQTICFELGGLLVAAPLYALVFGASASDSLLLLSVLSVAVMLWSALHNTLFDVVEFRLTHRTASERPHLWRLVHAVSHEITSIVLTLPLVMWLGGLGLYETLTVNLGLTVLYTAYACLFHIGYDWLRPVSPTEAHPARMASSRPRNAA